ncbi:hypothetical protein Hanom_Chr00s000003g01605851 [Helianthus anomalus]
MVKIVVEIITKYPSSLFDTIRDDDDDQLTFKNVKIHIINQTSHPHTKHQHNCNKIVENK